MAGTREPAQHPSANLLLHCGEICAIDNWRRVAKSAHYLWAVLLARLS